MCVTVVSGEPRRKRRARPALRNYCDDQVVNLHAVIGLEPSEPCNSERGSLLITAFMFSMERWNTIAPKDSIAGLTGYLRWGRFIDTMPTYRPNSGIARTAAYPATNASYNEIVLRAKQELHMPGKRIQFDKETLSQLNTLASDSMKSFQELADEAFRDLLKKHSVPATLKEALRRSAKEENSGTVRRKRIMKRR